MLLLKSTREHHRDPHDTPTAMKLFLLLQVLDLQAKVLHERQPDKFTGHAGRADFSEKKTIKTSGQKPGNGGSTNNHDTKRDHPGDGSVHQPTLIDAPDTSLGLETRLTWPDDHGRRHQRLRLAPLYHNRPKRG